MGRLTDYFNTINGGDSNPWQSNTDLPRAKKYECYFDGACEPYNPGGSLGGGIYIKAGDKEFFDSFYLPSDPENTNNIAEYMAFIRVVELLKDADDCKIDIYGDSNLVVCQMNRRWKIKDGAYKPYALRALMKISQLRQRNTINLKWIPRELNEIADTLSKDGI
jgi:ribonuclease HI